MELKNVVISTDGACSGNPGPGGYAAVLRFGEHWKTISGFESQTTNNRMELRAVNEAVRILKKPCSITIRTDSQIVCNAIANLEARSKNGWKTKTGARCANVDLLMQMHKLVTDGQHELRYEYVPGHSGDADNEQCDTLAKAEIHAHMG